MRFLGLEWRRCTAITTITCTVIMTIAIDTALFHRNLNKSVMDLNERSEGEMPGFYLSFHDVMIPGGLEFCFCKTALPSEVFPGKSRSKKRRPGNTGWRGSLIRNGLYNIFLLII